MEILKCVDAGTAGLIKIIKNFLNVIWIIAPILLIISLAILFTKLAANPDEKKYRKQITNSIKSLVIFFLIPTLINTFMYICNDKFTVSSCWNDPEVDTAFEETSDYIVPANTKRGSIVGNPSDYENGNPVASASVQKLLDAAKNVTDYIKNNNFTYGNAPYNPAINHDAKLVSCDRCVGWFLYEIGYTDQPTENGLVVYDASGAKDLTTYLQNKGFKKITNLSDVQAGDIMFTNPSSSGHPGHTFLLGNNLGNGLWERYDCGSNDRIHSTQPFQEGVANFMYAYRMPNA